MMVSDIELVISKKVLGKHQNNKQLPKGLGAKVLQGPFLYTQQQKRTVLRNIKIVKTLYYVRCTQ